MAWMLTGCQTRRSGDDATPRLILPMLQLGVKSHVSEAFNRLNGLSRTCKILSRDAISQTVKTVAKIRTGAR